MELKNYPSGDEEFDNWFRETQPDWAAEIDAKIAKDNLFDEMLEALENLMSAYEGRMGDWENPEFNEVYNIAADVVKRAKGES
jgi:hypothetical protein